MEHDLSYLPPCYGGGEGCFDPCHDRVSAPELRLIFLLHYHYDFHCWPALTHVIGVIRKKYQIYLGAQGLDKTYRRDPGNRGLDKAYQRDRGNQRLAKVRTIEVKRTLWLPSEEDLTSRYSILLRGSRKRQHYTPSDLDILHYWENKFHQDPDQELKTEFFEERHNSLKCFWDTFAESDPIQAPHNMILPQKASISQLCQERQHFSTSTPPYSPPPQKAISSAENKRSSPTSFIFSEKQEHLIFALYRHAFPPMKAGDIAKSLNKLSTADPPPYSSDAGGTCDIIDARDVICSISQTPLEDRKRQVWWPPMKKKDERREEYDRILFTYEWGSRCSEENIDLQPPKRWPGCDRQGLIGLFLPHSNLGALSL